MGPVTTVIRSFSCQEEARKPLGSFLDCRPSGNEDLSDFRVDPRLGLVRAGLSR